MEWGLFSPPWVSQERNRAGTSAAMPGPKDWQVPALPAAPRRGRPCGFESKSGLSAGPSTSPRPPDPSVPKLLLLLSIPNTSLSLSSAPERSLCPSSSWAWWGTDLCQATHHCHAELNPAGSKLPHPQNSPPAAAPTHLDAVQRRHPHVQKDPIQHRHRDVLQNSGAKGQRGGQRVSGGGEWSAGCDAPRGLRLLSVLSRTCGCSICVLHFHFCLSYGFKGFKAQTCSQLCCSCGDIAVFTERKHAPSSSPCFPAIQAGDREHDAKPLGDRAYGSGSVSAVGSCHPGTPLSF